MPGAAADRVLIAGGGIGGLALAVALARQGRQSLVLEARSAFAPAGAGIQIGPNGVHVLQVLGVAPHLAPFVGIPELIDVVTGLSGKRIATLPLGDWIAARHGAPYWVAHRADLHAALKTAADASPLIEIFTGFPINAIRDEGGQVEVSDDAGRTTKGAVLVGADGLWSKVREHIASGRAPVFAGASASRVVIPAAAAGRLAGNAVGLWLSPKAHVVHYPLRGGSEIAAVVITEETWQSRVWDAEADRTQLNAHLAHFHDDLAHILMHAEGWRRWSLNRLAELPAWTRGRVALLGDAAHPMFPYLAQGGVLALEDAIVLAQHLSSGRPDAEALQRYADERRPRARRVQEASRRNGWIYHLGWPMSVARDSVMAAAPGTRLMAGLDWLYGWRA